MKSPWISIRTFGKVGFRPLVFNPTTHTIEEQDPNASLLDQETQTDNYTATGMEDRIDCNNSSGGKVVTLPTPVAGLYRRPRNSIGNVGDAGNWSVVIADGSSFTGGATSVTLAPGDNLETYVTNPSPGVYKWHRA